MSADILWHNQTTGEPQIWFMDRNRMVARGTVISADPTDPNRGHAALVGLPWKIVGAGDFNRNGNADVLWYNEHTGESQIWFMDQNRMVARGTVISDDPTDPNRGNAALVGHPWSIVGVGDFNGNGNADILWHNEQTGEPQIWFMEQNRMVARGTVISDDPTDPNRGNPALVGRPWNIVGVGDFNGNGNADVLWYNEHTGESQIWFMHQNRMVARGTVVSADPTDPNRGNVALVGPPWSVVGVAAFNGHASADILWHNAQTGEPQVWFMEQNRMVARGTVISADPTDPNRGNAALVGLPWAIVGAGEFDPLTTAGAAIRDFHASTGGVLVVGSEVGPTRAVGDGAHEQRYEFGSILKPRNGQPDYATRYLVTIEIAAIKCFGTDDPSGTDEPYIVVAAFGVDPMVRDEAVQTNEIHFGSVVEKSIFARGQRLTRDPMLIPGDGDIRLVISLWEEEMARPSALQDKWREAATAAILAGLIRLNPAAGAAAAALEASKKIVTDASRELVKTVTDFLGLSDDHLGTCEFLVTADFLKRLIADGSGLPRTSGSIPGIRYNFPELPENLNADGRSWWFEGGGGSYRIFLSVRAAEVHVSPRP